MKFSFWSNKLIVGGSSKTEVIHRSIKRVERCGGTDILTANRGQRKILIQQFNIYIYIFFFKF